MSSLRAFHSPLKTGRIELSAEESHHLGHVLRCRVGDVVELFDGEERQADGVVVSLSRRTITVDVSTVFPKPYSSSFHLTLAVALPRSHRQTFLFEKCTELGVRAIWPLLTERGVAKPRSGQTEKWRRTCIEAAKQSRRCWLPRLEAPQSLDAIVERFPEFDVVYLTDREASSGTMADHLLTLAYSRSLLALVGPEGGFTSEEIGRVVQAGAIATQLCDGVLRIETAAVAVAAMVAALSSRSEVNSVDTIENGCSDGAGY